MPFRDNQEMLTDPVFLIGNGNSRQGFDLERLRSIGTIIGCNALYREFTPDLLIAIDAKMLKELKGAGYGEENLVIMPRNRTQNVPKSRTWKTERFNTSGCFAMKLISQLMKPKTCYMIGMDGYPGNVYDGTQNYAANTLQNFKGVNGYYLKVLKEKGETMFVNVNNVDKWPEEAHKTGRYTSITYEEFEKTILCSTS
jgi:hypothetical protein